jgi:hypothetical protein
MGRLVARQQIPGINMPGRVEEIVKGLFPTHVSRTRRTWTSIEEFEPLTTSEVQEIAVNITSNKAPGPDNIPDEAIRLLLIYKPEQLSEVLKK